MTIDDALRKLQILSDELEEDMWQSLHYDDVKNAIKIKYIREGIEASISILNKEVLDHGDGKSNNIFKRTVDYIFNRL